MALKNPRLMISLILIIFTSPRVDGVSIRLVRLFSSWHLQRHLAA